MRIQGEDFSSFSGENGVGHFNIETSKPSNLAIMKLCSGKVTAFPVVELFRAYRKGMAASMMDKQGT